MNVRTKVTTKAPEPEIRRSGKDSQRSTPASSPRSIHSPVDQVLSLHRTIGNAAVGRLLYMPGPEIRMKPAPACVMSGNESKIRTRIVGNPPRKYYGADFNHTFASDPEGCSLGGFQVSEHVTTQRDDFRVGATDVALGQKIWTLTESNSLDSPDRIRTRAGANGIGANPLRRWPAVLDQNQLWYFRRPPSTVWQLGPGIMVKVMLNGNPDSKNTLTVTTTDHGVSKTESYRGPAVRLSR